MSLRIWRYGNPYYNYNYYRPTFLCGGVTGEPENHNRVSMKEVVDAGFS